VLGAAKAGGGWQESVNNHTAVTTGNDMSVQWMTEQWGGRKIGRATTGQRWQWGWRQWQWLMWHQRWWQWNQQCWGNNSDNCNNGNEQRQRRQRQWRLQ
jgi:hypothetical protein